MLEITTLKEKDAYQQDAFKQTEKRHALHKLKEASEFATHDECTSELASRAITLAETLDDVTKQVESSVLLAEHYLAEGKLQKVVDTLEPFLVERLELHNHTRAQLLLPLIGAYYRLEEIAKVLRYGAEALKLFQVQGDVSKQAQLHDYLGDACIRCSSYHEALEHHLVQLELLKSQGANLAEPYLGVGRVYRHLDDYKSALTFLREGLDRALQENNETVAGRCLGSIANVYDYMEDRVKALDYHQRAIDIFEAHNDLRRAMIGYGNIGNTHFEIGDIAQALVYYHKALTQLKRTPNLTFEGWILIQIGEALLKTSSAEAERYLLDGLTKLTEAGSNEGVEQAHYLLSKLYELRGDAVKALKHYKTYAEIQIQHLKDHNEKRTLALSIQFEVDHLQQEQEIYHLKNVELARAVEQLEELSTRDGLTGLYNRRYLDEHLAKIFIEAQVNSQPLTVLIADIDNFKAVNDNLSHATGDTVLKIVAKLFDDPTWGADIVARYGGEEFVIVFKETSLDKVLHIAEKLRLKIAAYPWREHHPELAITLSMGLCGDPSLGDHERMLAIADDNLYKAKRSGKDKVVS